MEIVTGAFGYIGRYIAAQLIDQGREVRTITTHIDKPNPFGNKISISPYSFDSPELLTQALRGAETLYNTYWIRFEHGDHTFKQAVANTRTLFDCAAEAGIKKIVHISVSNASADSSLPYYAGKARQEAALADLGVSYSVIRPTLVFGVEDILVNNIAWLIRKFPLFPIMGDGSYRLQPVYVGDLASIAINSAGQEDDSKVDAIGPETFTYLEFVETISAAISKKVKLVKVAPRIGILLGQLIGLFVNDVILTRDELQGLMENHLTSRQEPNGPTKFSEWIWERRESIGLKYSSELDRHFRYSKDKHG